VRPEGFALIKRPLPPDVAAEKAEMDAVKKAEASPGCKKVVRKKHPTLDDVTKYCWPPN
jgi:hypothetical protein